MKYFVISRSISMRYELFIAKRLKFSETSHRGSLSLNIALVGIILAIVVMIVSITVMMGFRDEITNKIYSLDPHIKISNAVLGIDDNYATINGREAFAGITADSSIMQEISSMTLIADKPAILKTDNDFKGIQFRGVDNGFDWSYIKQQMISGTVPSDTSLNEIIISKVIAGQLGLHVGDRVLTYFIDDKVKVRNMRVTGIFSTDFENYDNALIMGNIALVQQINGWNADTGNFIGVNLKDVNRVRPFAYTLYSTLARYTYTHQSTTLFHVTHTRENNMSFFSWLSMLDMNVIIILVLMMIVAGFTLVSALLMIVLERIRMIGLLKALGSTNGSVRQIFIFLTQKLILKAIIYGNAIGLGIALLQKYCHIVKLDANAYYMPFVPISINWPVILALNIGIIIVSYLTLVGPSFIISTIKPTSTMRFE